MSRLLVLALVLLTGCGTAAPADPPPQAVPAAVLQPCPAAPATPTTGGAPDVALPCLAAPAGPPVSLARLPRGVPTVVNLYASWCAPCRDELPALAEMSRAYGDRVRFVGVLTQDPGERWQGLLGRAQVDYPSLRDDEGTVQAQSGAPGLPFTMLVAPDGEVVTRHPGPLDAAGLATLLSDELGVAAPTPLPAGGSAG